MKTNLLLQSSLNRNSKYVAVENVDNVALTLVYARTNDVDAAENKCGRQIARSTLRYSTHH